MKNQLNKTVIYTALLTAGIVGQVQAAGPTFIPSVALVHKSAEYGTKLSSTDPGTVSEGNYFAVNLSLTAAFDSFYATLVLDQGITEGDFDTAGGGDITNDGVVFTVGCNCISAIPDLTMFAGFASTDATINSNLDDGNPATDLVEEANDSGLFIGVSYPLISSASGRLTGTLAYASMDGETDVTSDSFVGAIGDDTISLSGDTTGLSYGLTWAGQLTETMDYSLSFKVQDYQTDADTISFAATTAPLSGVELDRKFNMFSAQITSYF